MRTSFKIDHHKIYFFGLILVVIGLPLSKILMSCGQILLVGNWLIEGGLKNKFKVFLKNKTALVISSVFLLHLIGLIYTTDFNYAYIDLRLKIPLIVLPLIISTSETLTGKRFQALLFIFITAVIVSTLASMYNYFTIDFVDIRYISAFISHIRLSLLVCLSIFILFYFIVSNEKFSRIQKLFFLAMIIWLIIFLIILESITGLSVLLITGLFLLVIEIFKMKRTLHRIWLIAILVIVPFFIFTYIHNIYKEYFSFSPDKNVKLEKYTAHGNPYAHDTINNEIENGHYVWRNFCDQELRDAWNKRSKFVYDGKDRKTQYIKYTLFRFLTSKNYSKDADGVNKLSLEDVRAIENGIANINCINRYSLRTRIYETIWEYENYKMTANPNGHSVMQRLEYWKTSLGIIKDHLIFGVGTGDMNIAFEQQYKKMNSPLDTKWRLRSHDQFLSITVGFGLFGLLWFLISLAYPFLYSPRRRDYYYLIFFTIIILSMLAEDTIESQAGLTFFAFFNSLFLFGREKENENLSLK